MDADCAGFGIRLRISALNNFINGKLNEEINDSGKVWDSYQTGRKTYTFFAEVIDRAELKKLNINFHKDALWARQV